MIRTDILDVKQFERIFLRTTILLAMRQAAQEATAIHEEIRDAGEQPEGCKVRRVIWVEMWEAICGRQSVGSRYL